LYLRSGVPRKAEYTTESANVAVTKLRALPGSLREIAAAVGAKTSTVADWKHARKRPTRRFRERIATVYSEIRPSDWDSAIDQAEQVQAELHEHGIEVDPADLSSVDSCNRLLREVRAARRDPNITPATLGKLVARETVILKFRQDALNNDVVLQDAHIRQNPKWLRVHDIVSGALAKHKEAAADVLAALEQLSV
jgi:hypothetical protein